MEIYNRYTVLRGANITNTMYLFVVSTVSPALKLKLIVYYSVVDLEVDVDIQGMNPHSNYIRLAKFYGLF